MGWVSAEFSPQTDEGEEISVRNAAGEVCVSVPACRTMTSIDVTIEFCSVDTDMFAIMMGRDPLVDENGVGIGFDICDLSCSAGFALEIWTGVHSESGCGIAGGDAQFGYFVLPWISSATLGDWTVEDGAVSFSITGSARSGSGWGRGPYPVQGGPNGPQQLDPPLDPSCFGRLILTSVEPPVDACGCQELTGCDNTITGISVEPCPMTRPQGTTQQLSVFANETDGGVQPVTNQSDFVSSDPLVASVSAGGLVTMESVGSATITVTWTDPDTAQVHNSDCIVTVE
jgi:hypothetical protein